MSCENSQSEEEGRLGLTFARWLLALALCCLLLACGGGASSSPAPAPSAPANPLDSYNLTGDVKYVHDPSMYQQGNTWYLFSTDDNNPGGHLPVRCSSDLVNFKLCGFVFQSVPAWIQQRFPSLVDLWAPEVSYFNGVYHLYYVASVFGTNNSVIALATNTTLNPSDPNYLWVDQGEVISTSPSDDYNALDPSILIDSDGTISMTFGSYWTGIKQRRLDPLTGKLSSADTTLYSIAARPGSTSIEAASLVKHNGYYYLFVSFDTCCNGANSTYRIMVGRSQSLHGPYLDQSGTPMLQGGATEVLRGKSPWAGPGGQTAIVNAQQNLVIFHAYAFSDGAPWLHLNVLQWVNDWPVLSP
jgi:arabinan endo-1,5-alpha-L-arabinosidase